MGRGSSTTVAVRGLLDGVMVGLQGQPAYGVLVAVLVAGAAGWFARGRTLGRTGVDDAGTRGLSGWGALAAMVLAVAAAVGAGALLWERPANDGRFEALKAAGGAAAIVIGSYTLFLTDQRRRIEERRQRTEEGRHALERARQDTEQDRVTNERFARAVELLGHDADPVRVGALHALAAIGSDHDDRRQVVIDICCAYLRRPFSHPSWEPTRGSRQETSSNGHRPAATPPWTDKARRSADRERQVRLAAQRLLRDLLPPAEAAADAAHPPHGYSVDLTRAVLDGLDLSGRSVLALRAGGARLHGTTRCEGAQFQADTVFDGARFHGDALFEAARFCCSASFEGAHFQGYTLFSGARFAGPAAFDRAHFHDDVLFGGAHFYDAGLFRRAHFYRVALFRGARFTGAAMFTRAHVLHDLDLGESVQLPRAWWELSDAAVDPSRWVHLPEGWRQEPSGSSTTARVVREDSRPPARPASVGEGRA